MKAIAFVCVFFFFLGLFIIRSYFHNCKCFILRANIFADFNLFSTNFGKLVMKKLINKLRYNQSKKDLKYS